MLIIIVKHIYTMMFKNYMLIKEQLMPKISTICMHCNFTRSFSHWLVIYRYFLIGCRTNSHHGICSAGF
jgi:hypothetical protein